MRTNGHVVVYEEVTRSWGVTSQRILGCTEDGEHYKNATHYLEEWIANNYPSGCWERMRDGLWRRRVDANTTEWAKVVDYFTDFNFKSL